MAAHVDIGDCTFGAVLGSCNVYLRTAMQGMLCIIPASNLSSLHQISSLSTTSTIRPCLYYTISPCVCTHTSTLCSGLCHCRDWRSVDREVLDTERIKMDSGV